MKRIIILLISATLSSVAVYAQTSFGQAENLDDGWKFILGDIADAKNADFDDAKWQTVDLPHDWSVKQPLSAGNASCQGFLPGGIGWYRRMLTVPSDRQNEKVYIYFEGVYNRSEVFVNGQPVGSRPNGYISFAFDLTPYIRFGTDNVIAVRVDHSQSADSRWYTGSGIYRDVWLVYANPVHIAQWGVYAMPDVAANRKSAKLHVETEVVNGAAFAGKLTVVNELYTPDGKLAARNTRTQTVASTADLVRFNVDLPVSNPVLWDLENPKLYTLKTSILKDGQKVDETTTVTGFRTFTFDADKGFALNGKSLKMKGVCIHHDAGVLGAAVPSEVWHRRLLALKEIGVNAIRTSHNPQAPELYDLCDRLGFLVMNEAYDEWEFPKNKWIAGWNVGTPGHQGSFDIFADWGERDLEDMVRRDRNHVSIFAWSIGNEVDYPNDPYSHPILDGGNDGFTQKMFGGYKPDAPDAMRLGVIAKRLVAAVKRYDSSRPVTAGLAGVAMSNETEYPGALDIAGYNYTESRYLSDHQKYPSRVIYGSENRHDLEAWKAVTDNEHIFGQFLWTGIDYLGESGAWPSRGFYSGLVDFGGFIKPRGYFRQSLWSSSPVIYLGTYPAGRPERSPSVDAWSIWNYDEGQTIRVVCYTNAAKAKLELNGRQVGEMKAYDSANGVISWDIPYQSGKLEAIGYDSAGNETARYTIRSSKRPYALQASVYHPDGETPETAQVIVQVVDEDGVPVMLSDDEITCRLTGPAKLTGLEASNNTDMGDYTDNRQRAFHGRLLAYIRAEGEGGEVKATFTSPWLKSVEVSLSVAKNND